MSKKSKYWESEGAAEAVPSYEASAPIVAPVATPESRLASAIAEIIAAIAGAQASGYFVDAPFKLKDLERISVSETAKVKN